jgi:hypothetical protein
MEVSLSEKLVLTIETKGDLNSFSVGFSMNPKHSFQNLLTIETDPPGFSILETVKSPKDCD